MISGTLVLEDLTINFAPHHEGENLVRYSIADSLSGCSTTMVVPQAAFLAALAIAVHSDGMPNYEADYEAAESVQPAERALRFIP